MGTCNLLWPLPIKRHIPLEQWPLRLFVSVLHAGTYGRVYAVFVLRLFYVKFVTISEKSIVCQRTTRRYLRARVIKFVIFSDQKPTYNTRQRIMLGVDKTFKRAWELHIYPAVRRIYSSNEGGKFLSFSSIFLLIYLYSDWQVCVFRCVVGFNLLCSDWQVCVLRCVVGFSVSQWPSVLFEYVICVWQSCHVYVCDCMHGWYWILFIWYDFKFCYGIKFNWKCYRFNNVFVVDLIKCSFIGNLFISSYIEGGW